MLRNQSFTPGSPFGSVPCSEICPLWYLLYPGILANLVMSAGVKIDHIAPRERRDVAE
jgi:hypothetical protein